MNFVRSIFGAVDRRYLIRAYVISVALLAYAILSAILFPFAKLVWDELRDMVLGNSSIIHFGWWAIAINFMLKIMVNVLLWFFAIGIAPLGVLYLWLRNRNTATHVD